MARRDAKLAAAFERVLQAETALDAEAVVLLYGPLPDWLPEPVRPKLEQAVATLRNAEQTPPRIVELAAAAGRDELEIPGAARDVRELIQAAYYLAHVQWALSLPKADAIRELGGSLAAQNYQRSRAGQRARSGMSDDARTNRDSSIRRRAQELAAQNPSISSNAQAAALAPEFQLSPRQIKRILKG